MSSSNPLIGEPRRPRIAYMLAPAALIYIIGFNLCSGGGGCESGCTREPHAKSRVGEMGPILRENDTLQKIKFGLKMIARARENGIAVNENEIAEYLLGAIGTLRGIRKGSKGRQKAECEGLIRKARILGGEALKSLVREKKNNSGRLGGKTGKKMLADAPSLKRHHARLPRNALRA